MEKEIGKGLGSPIRVPWEGPQCSGRGAGVPKFGCFTVRILGIQEKAKNRMQVAYISLLKKMIHLKNTGL